MRVGTFDVTPRVCLAFSQLLFLRGPLCLSSQAVPGGGHQSGTLFSAASAAMFGGGGSGSFTLDPELLPPPPAVRPHVHPAQQLADGMMPQLPFSLEQQLLLMQAAGGRQPHGGTPRSPAAPPHGTVFFAGVTPVVTADTLLTLFSQFGRVLDLNLFRPFKGCRTSKVGARGWAARLSGTPLSTF